MCVLNFCVFFKDSQAATAALTFCAEFCHMQTVYGSSMSLSYKETGICSHIHSLLINGTSEKSTAVCTYDMDFKCLHVSKTVTADLLV